MYSVQGRAAPIQSQVPLHGLSGAHTILKQGHAQAGPQGPQQAVAQYRQQNAGVGMGAGAYRGSGGAAKPAQEGIRSLNKWTQPGVAANNMQAALSGAMGNEAQAEAYANFNDSPGQQFLRERGEQAVLRNAAATGGTRGANVMKALSDYGQGMAQQDFQNYFNRAGTVADRGLAAQGQQTGLYDRMAQAATAREGYNAQLQAAAMSAGGAITAAGIAAEADLMRDAAKYAYDTGVRNAGNIQQTSSDLSRLIDSQGTNMGNIYNTGMRDIGNVFVGAGRDFTNSSTGRGRDLSNARLTGSNIYAGLTGLGPRGQDKTLENAGNIISAGAGLF